MFCTSTLNERFCALVESNNHSESIAFFLDPANAFSPSFTNICVSWLFDKYSKNPEPWMMFWSNLLAKSAKDGIGFPKNIYISYLTDKMLKNAIERSVMEFIAPMVSISVNPDDLFETLKSLASTNPKNIDAICEVPQYAEPTLRVGWYTKLIQFGLESYNGVLLSCLSKLKNVNFDALLTTLGLTEKEQLKLQELTELDLDKAIYVRERMAPFVKGVGCIQSDDALLTLAQIRDRKKDTYEFDPVLLKGKRQFESLLQLLRTAEKPISVRFVIDDGHYVSGEVTVNEANHAKLLILDSIGFNVKARGIKTNINTFCSIFSDYEVFYSSETRQNAPLGCAVFALDDIHHQFHLRLAPRYEETGIWGYLSDISKTEHSCEERWMSESGQEICISCCQLPLSFARTMQSARLFTEVIPGREDVERALIVNKRGETVAVSSERFFQADHTGKRRNTKIDYKLLKMTEYNWSFLKRHTPEEVEAAKNFFKLKQWSTRLEARPRSSSIRSIE